MSPSIGLRRGTVILRPHHDDWLALGADICLNVKVACKDLQVAVEHVGSTSVPGLTAKPILDLALGLPHKEIIDAVITSLTAIGFIYRGEGEGSVGFLFVLESEPDVRTIHLHAVLYGSSDWKDYVVFRDILRTTPTIVNAYEALKIQSAQQYPNDRKKYTATKVTFIRSVLASNGIYNA